MTPTLKLKHAVIDQKYGTLIDLASKLQGERSQPRGGDIFVEQRYLGNPSSGGAAYSVAHKWARTLKNLL